MQQLLGTLWIGLLAGRHCSHSRFGRGMSGRTTRVAYWLVSTSYAAAHPDVVARLVKADIVANEWIANAEANPTSTKLHEPS